MIVGPALQAASSSSARSERFSPGKTPDQLRWPCERIREGKSLRYRLRRREVDGVIQITGLRYFRCDIARRRNYGSQAAGLVPAGLDQDSA